MLGFTVTETETNPQYSLQCWHSDFVLNYISIIKSEQKPTLPCFPLQYGMMMPQTQSAFNPCP